MNNLSFVACEMLSNVNAGGMEENVKGVGGLGYGGMSQEMDNKNFERLIIKILRDE